MNKYIQAAIIWNLTICIGNVFYFIYSAFIDESFFYYSILESIVQIFLLFITFIPISFLFYSPVLIGVFILLLFIKIPNNKTWVFYVAFPFSTTLLYLYYINDLFPNNYINTLYISYLISSFVASTLIYYYKPNVKN